MGTKTNRKLTTFLVLSSSLLLLLCCKSEKKMSSYDDLYKEKPVTVLVAPVQDNTKPLQAKTTQDKLFNDELHAAACYLQQTVAEPLIAQGYYTPAPLASEAIMGRINKDYKQLMRDDLKELSAQYGIDAVLLVAIHKWQEPEINEIVVYGKKDGSIVHMIRDRARINFRYMFDFKRGSTAVEPGHTVTVNGQSYTIAQDGTITIGNQKFKMEANPTDYTITKIDWILSNGLDHGFIAPYYEGHTDHFDNYYDPSQTPALKEDRLTPYDKANGKRYKATVDDMVTCYENGATVDAPLFLFEDLNDTDDPPKLILRVAYTRDNKPAIVKYHTLMLLNENSEPCKIYRNHSYVLDIFGLPWEGLGYLSFEDAVNSTTYANNMTVTINDKVPEVNDGRFKLTIVGDTYLIFQNPADAGQQKEILFTYAAAKAGESTSDLTIDDFRAGWSNTPRPEFASETITLAQVSNDGTTFTGKIIYTLGTSIGSNLQGGQIELHDTKTGMSRFVNIYTITKFVFLPEGAASLTLVRDGTATRQVNGVSCNTYYMDVLIPGDYPIGLYPIKIRMASTTLNPFKVKRLDNNVEDDNIAVTMDGTENGTNLDGEVLAGMNFTTTSGQWNYRAASDPWNFWYIEELETKPTKEENGETVEDKDYKTYRIYFDDIRPLRAAGNRPSNIGLFLKIKYFGDAVSVALTP